MTRGPRAIFGAVLLVSALASPPAAPQVGGAGETVTAEQLLASAQNMHPAGYFQLAALLLPDDPAEAGKWLYVAQIRYRFHLAAQPNLDPSGDPALGAALMDAVGTPVNQKLGADFDLWLGAMDAALAWDAANANGFTSKTRHAAELSEIRAGLAAFRNDMSGRREEAAEARRQNGLPVR